MIAKNEARIKPNSIDPVGDLIARLEKVTPRGRNYLACCPAHRDRTPSLSISRGDDGRALVKCFAGCTAESICAAIGITLADLMPADSHRQPSGKPHRQAAGVILKSYDYYDADGELQLRVDRLEPKSFRQRRPDGRGGWIGSGKGAPPLLYRLQSIIAANDGRPVFVVEGEKDADNLIMAGLVATTNPGGAKNWTDDHAKQLADRHVVILSDNDEPGRERVEKVAASLWGIAASIRVVDLPGLPEKGDVTDWLNAGGDADQLVDLAESAKPWTPAAREWPELQAFGMDSLPAFPVHCLPPVLSDWVTAEATATQTPRDLAASLALAVVASTIAGRVTVQPRLGWIEPTNLYTTAVLDPANRKSAVFADATAPLRALEQEERDAVAPEVERERAERRMDEKRLAKLEKMAVDKGDAEAAEQAVELAVELAQRPPAHMPRRIVADVTDEKLAMLMEAQGGRILSASAEGEVFGLMAGRYTRDANFETYLKGHSGDLLMVDRVGRESIRIERPAMSICYTVQPQVIARIVGNPEMRGRGLLARFLWAMPESYIGRRLSNPPPVPWDVTQAYHDLIVGLGREAGELTLSLDHDALELFTEWQDEVELMLADGGDMEAFRDWGGKTCGATLRIAAGIHCCRDTSDTIDLETIAAAIEIARCYIKHAEAVLCGLAGTSDPVHGDAKYLLAWIKRHERSEFRKTEAHHHGKRRWPAAEDMEPAIDELIRRGFIRRAISPPKGPGRPTIAYEVNPAVFKINDNQNRSFNSLYSDMEQQNEGFGNKRSALRGGENEIDDGENRPQKPQNPSSTQPETHFGNKRSAFGGGGNEIVVPARVQGVIE